MTSTIICFFTLKFWIGTLLPVKGTKTVTENTALAVVVDRNRWAGWFSNDEPTQPIESLMEISDDWQDRGTSGANQISTGAGAPLAPPLDPPLHITKSAPLSIEPHTLQPSPKRDTFPRWTAVFFCTMLRVCMKWPLALSLSAGSDLWWWMRHVISPHSLVFHEQGSVRIPVLSGPPFYTNTCFPCLHKDSWEKSRVDTTEHSHTKRCVWGAFNCDW